MAQTPAAKSTAPCGILDTSQPRTRLKSLDQSFPTPSQGGVSTTKFAATACVSEITSTTRSRAVQPVGVRGFSSSVDDILPEIHLTALQSRPRRDANKERHCQNGDDEKGSRSGSSRGLGGLGALVDSDRL